MTYKERSETWLRARGFPICTWLEDDEGVLPLRPAEQVAKRTVVLLGLAGMCYPDSDAPPEFVREWLTSYGVIDELSPGERAFLDGGLRDMDMRMAISWRFESATALAWSLGWMAEMPDANVQSGSDPYVLEVVNGDCRGMIERATLRPEPEIHAARDLTLRIHWAVVEHHLKKLPPPNGVQPGIVYERHYALNWLTDPDTPWDDVQTHT